MEVTYERKYFRRKNYPRKEKRTFCVVGHHSALCRGNYGNPGQQRHDELPNRQHLPACHSSYFYPVPAHRYVWLDSLLWAESIKTPGSTRPDTVWQIHRHPQGRRFLFRQSLLFGRESRGPHEAEPERGCKRYEYARLRLSQYECTGGCHKKTLLKGYDLKQQPPENQRLPG